MICSNTEGLFRIIQRDHMTDLELIFSMLGERATTEITQVKNSKGFNSLKNDSQSGGKIAGDARSALEKKTGQRISTKDNYLQEKQKNLKLK